MECCICQRESTWQKGAEIDYGWIYERGLNGKRRAFLSEKGIKKELGESKITKDFLLQKIIMPIDGESLTKVSKQIQ